VAGSLSLPGSLEVLVRLLGGGLCDSVAGRGVSRGVALLELLKGACRPQDLPLVSFALRVGLIRSPDYCGDGCGSAAGDGVGSVWGAAPPPGLARAACGSPRPYPNPQRRRGGRVFAEVAYQRHFAENPLPRVSPEPSAAAKSSWRPDSSTQ
jgi:hypothetical protein